MNVVLISAIILGFSSSLHCIGMCGPISMVLPINRTSTTVMILQILTYNFGRILVYGILGLIIGSIGFTLQTFQFLQWLSIFSGVILILFAWKKYFKRFHLAGNFSSFPFISKAYGRILKSNSRFKLFSLGMINGLLPCGMVYIALLNAILGANLLISSSAMILFGLGTLPAMLTVAFTASKITGEHRNKINKVLPVALTVVGLLIITRGLNLGIPYLSPAVHVEQAKIPNQENCEVENQNKIVKMDCCHSKKNQNN